MFWDLFDDVLGPLNFVDRITGWLQLQTRRGSRRRRYRDAASASVRITHPRPDKVPGAIPIMQVRAHLRKYGVDSYAYTHDARNFYFSVPKRQEEWFKRLYNNGQLWSPRTAWADNPRRRKPTPN